MKILLDERLPLDFRHSIPGHVVHTVQWTSLKGMKIGGLLPLVESILLALETIRPGEIVAAPMPD
jgi:hypothetical protein